ncbi:carboxypeptidase B [Lucilia sericata]|uniref:carboxypeptidase B n=1 Tax=Lucilia sericata TaxID=13632 RepID=UPI0018A86BC8|nr:carboxypeptidase B [Lucilia sericata]
MSLAKLVLVISLLNGTLIQAYKDYKDYKIYDIKAENAEQLEMLKKIVKLRKNFDFLNLAKHPSKPTKVLIPHYREQELRNILDKYELNYTLLVEDVSEIIVKERLYNSRESPAIYPLNVFEAYYRHEEINENMEYLAKLYPSRVFVKTFGRTYEQRPLKIITITNGDGVPNKKIIFIDAAMHAREWITPSMALYIMNELILNFESYKHLLQDFDWIIMPLVNADGYEYTHEEDRYWRKTRKPNNFAQDCYGTDPNRNFGFQWGSDEGASADPCDETYYGDKPFSEPETQVVRDIMITYAHRIKWYLSLHSYGNYILLPYGHTKDLPDNYFDMMDVADAGALAIILATNSIYTYGNTYSVMYPTSGDSADYATGYLHIPIAMAMELPAGGFSGFDPPVRQIEDIVVETWVGIKAMAEVVVQKY